jgi:hypothetical protein
MVLPFFEAYLPEPDSGAAVICITFGACKVGFGWMKGSIQGLSPVGQVDFYRAFGIQMLGSAEGSPFAESWSANRQLAFLSTMPLRFDVSSENGVHAGQVSFATRLEPLDHVAVETQVNGVFPFGITTRADFQNSAPSDAAAGAVLAALALCTDLAKRMSHDSLCTQM